jgi:hypothetical protein
MRSKDKFKHGFSVTTAITQERRTCTTRQKAKANEGQEAEAYPQGLHLLHGIVLLGLNPEKALHAVCRVHQLLA